MAANFSKRYYDKTELVLIGHPRHLAKIGDFEFSIGNVRVKAFTCARNLALVRQFAILEVVHPMAAVAATFHIRLLAAVRDHRPRELTPRLRFSLLINSRDCCNSFLAGLPKCSPFHRFSWR